MTLISRRALVAAAGTVAMATPLRKPRAAPLQDIGALEPLETPLPVTVGFTDAGDVAHAMAEYAGRGVVLNLWATWCVPCVAEMPALDAFAGRVAADGIVVLPLSSDRGGASVVQRFFTDNAISHLPVLLDARSAAAHALQVRGIPTTFIIDRKGRAVARLEGTADWSTDAALAAVRKLVGTPPVHA